MYIDIVQYIEYECSLWYRMYIEYESVCGTGCI